MKNILILVAFMLVTPAITHADQPEGKKPVPAAPLKQVSVQPERKRAAEKRQTRTFEILKKISAEQQLMIRRAKDAEKYEASKKDQSPAAQIHSRHAEFLGKKIPFREAPGSSATTKSQSPNQVIATNILINGKTADTVYVGDKEVITFSFTPGFISGLLAVYYDADKDGLVTERDPLLSSSILCLDNDENDSDPATGKYSLVLGAKLWPEGLVGSYLFSLNDFQSLSTALLVVRQRPAPAVVRISTNPPIPMVFVQVYSSGPVGEYLFTDSTGKADVSIDRLVSPQVQIELYDFLDNAGSYIPPPTQNVSLTSDTTLVVFTYTRASSFIQGLYLDDKGNPIPKARVYASGNHFVSTKTDSTGSFTLGVETGSWSLDARPTSADYMVSNRSVQLIVTPNSTTHLNLTSVKTNSNISGKVQYSATGVGGVPIVGSQDTLWNEILTGVNGSYSLPVWKPQSGSFLYYVYPSLDNYVYYPETPPAYVLPGTQNVNFTLVKTTGGIAGKVFDWRTGRPVGGTTISVTGPAYRSCTTNDSGLYRLTLRNGDYYVNAYAAGYFNYTPPNPITVAGAVVTLDIVLHPCGVMSGTIRDKDGKPIPYAQVSAHDTAYMSFGYGYSDTSGRYFMGNLTTGSYVVMASAYGYVTTWYPNATDPLDAELVPVQEGSETPNIDFALSRGASISGKVTDRAGVPLPGASVTVYDSSFLARSYAVTNDSGHYLASGMPTGDYLVYASDYPYVSVWYDNAPTFSTATKVHAVVDQITRDINFSLSKGASISGYVKDYRMKPLQYVYVYVVDTLFGGYQGASTNDSGWYQIAGLPAGVYKATAQWNGPPQWYDHKTSFETADTIRLSLEENRGGIDFDLRRWPGIYGSVIDDSSGVVIANATIYAMSDDGAYYRTLTNYTGSYSMSVYPGSYVVRVAYEDSVHACRYYYTSHGVALLQRDGDKITVTENGVPPTIDFRLPVDKKDFTCTHSNLQVTMTNRGALGNWGDTSRPSCRWPNPQGKDYLYEADLWVGGMFGGYMRTFGDFYGSAPQGRWHAATNFLETRMLDSEKVQTSFYNTDYSSLWSGVSVVVREEMDTWTNANFALCHQTLYHDGPPSMYQPEISGLCTGLFADFDVSDRGRSDLVGFDTANSLIYVYDSGKIDSTYVGLCVLGPQPARFTWWQSGNDSSCFSEYARNQLLRTDAGGAVPTHPDEYRVLVSTGPYTLNAGDSIKVTFAFVAGRGKTGITEAAKAARAKYVTTTAVHDRTPSAIPEEFVLYQNYPNPFNPTTVIRYDVAGVRDQGSVDRGQSPVVSLKVYELLGREVAVLVNERQAPGSYSVKFDADGLASGIYFYRMTAGEFVLTKEMIVLR